MMARTFREAFRGVRRQLIEAINVSDLLLVDLLDEDILTNDQYHQLLVRNYIMLTSRTSLRTE